MSRPERLVLEREDGADASTAPVALRGRSVVRAIDDVSPERPDPTRRNGAGAARGRPGMEAHVAGLLELLGEDTAREGLARTPHRVAEALRWLTRGYEMDYRAIVRGAVFAEAHESMVVVKDIELYSLCEHHMLPFFGRAHIAYVPDGRIVGLSKLPRLVEVFARRLQVQERLTDQIADALEETLQPKGVGVLIEASHLCMMMRGVEKQNSRTVTSAVRGLFRSCAMTRDEFLRLVRPAA